MEPPPESRGGVWCRRLPLVRVVAPWMSLGRGDLEAASGAGGDSDIAVGSAGVRVCTLCCRPAPVLQAWAREGNLLEVCSVCWNLQKALELWLASGPQVSQSFTLDVLAEDQTSEFAEALVQTLLGNAQPIRASAAAEDEISVSSSSAGEPTTTEDEEVGTAD